MALTTPHSTNRKPAYAIAAPRMAVAIAFVRSRNIGARRIDAARRADRRHALRPPRRRIAALYAFIATDRLTLTTRYTVIASAIASIACPV